MNNKSLILKNKLYRFSFLLFSFIFFIYVIYFLINADRGIVAHNKIIKKYSLLNEERNDLIKINIELEDKISRLSTDTLDLDYLDEKLRLNTGKITKNEIIIKFDN